MKVQTCANSDSFWLKLSNVRSSHAPVITLYVVMVGTITPYVYSDFLDHTNTIKYTLLLQLPAPYRNVEYSGVCTELWDKTLRLRKSHRIRICYLWPNFEQLTFKNYKVEELLEGSVQ